MYLDYTYESDDEMHELGTLDNLQTACWRLSERHFGRFDRVRMSFATGKKHLLVRSKQELEDHLAVLHKDYRFANLWKHCVSGVYVDELGRKVDVIGFRLFSRKEPFEMYFIYLPIDDGLERPISYFDNMISKMGNYSSRPTGEEMLTYIEVES